MSAGSSDGGGTDGGERGTSRNVVGPLLVLCGVLGLLLAATLVPSLPVPPVAGGGDGAGSGTGAGTSTGATTSTSGGVAGGTAASGIAFSDPAYRIELAPDPVPGATVTATVLKGSAPVEGVRVAVNGRVAGRTDQFGRVPVTIPYAENVTLTATRPEHREASAPAAVGRADGRYFDLGAPTALLARPHESNETNVTDEESPPTRIDVAVDRAPRPGETVTLTAWLRDRRVPDATVRVDGARVGRTDDHGEFALAVPAAERTNVTVSRGDASGNATLTVPPIAIEVESAPLPFPLAGRPARVDVTRAGSPVAGATVTVDGEPVGTTDRWGELAVRLPSADAATIGARTDGFAAEARVTGLKDPFYAAGALVLGLLVAGAVALRTGRTLRSVVRVGPVEFVRWLVGAVLAGLVLGSRRTTDLLAALGRRVRAEIARLRRLPAWLRSHDPIDAVRRAATATVSAIRAWLRARLEGGKRGFRRLRSLAPGMDGPAGDDATPDDDADPDDRHAIREAWAELMAATGSSGNRTETPGEIARRAVAMGLPSAAVAALTDAFRDVEYGGHLPSRRVERARAAIVDIRESRVSAGEGGEER